jgi:hypothetical protein
MYRATAKAHQFSIDFVSNKEFRVYATDSMVCIKANIAVRPELVEGGNRGFITFMLRQAQHERSEFTLGTYH